MRSEEHRSPASFFEKDQGFGETKDQSPEDIMPRAQKDTRLMPASPRLG